MWNIPLYCVNIYHCVWFNKETDWLVAGQDKVRERAKDRRLGTKRVKLRVTVRPRETRWYQATWQRIDKKYGLI